MNNVAGHASFFDAKISSPKITRRQTPLHRRLRKLRGADDSADNGSNFGVSTCADLHVRNIVQVHLLLMRKKKPSDT